MDKIKTVKIKNPDGSISEESYTISVDAKDVDMLNGDDLQNTINNMNQELNDLNDNINILNIETKKKAYFFNTVADMKADKTLKEGDFAITLGYYSANDDGGGNYRIIRGNYIIDNGSYHRLSNSLYAELIIKNQVNIKQFGAYGDGTHDDTQAIQNAVNKTKNVYINKGTFLVSSTINLPNLIQLHGAGVTNSTIKVSIDNGSALFKLESTIAHFNISDFYIVASSLTGKNFIGFDISNPYDSCTIKNIHFAALANTCIKCGNSSTISQSLIINNCMCYGPNVIIDKSMVMLEKCYEVNFLNNKLLYQGSYFGTVPCLYLKNTYDFYASGNSFADTTSYAIQFDGEARYNRLIGNTYENISSADGIVFFNGANQDDGQYNIIIETNYYNATRKINCINCCGNIVIGPKNIGGRRNFTMDVKSIATDAYGNNYIYNDGGTAYMHKFGFTDYQEKPRFRFYCEDSQYADNGLKILDIKNNQTVEWQLRRKSFKALSPGYKIGLVSPDGNTTKYIGIDNNGEIQLYDSEN